MVVIEECCRRPIAQESPKTKRARAKLAEKFVEENKQFTPQALEKRVQAIHDWIAERASDRVPVKKERGDLFNRNHDPAELSGKVRRIFKNLQEEMAPYNRALKPNQGS